VAALGVASLVLIGLIGWALFALRVPATCSYSALQGFASFGIVSAAVAGFIAGHLLGRWFEPAREARALAAFAARASLVPDVGASEAETLAWQVGGDASAQQELFFTGQVRQPRRALVVQATLVVLLALVTLLLVYETVALVATNVNWPITYYVRCFASSKPLAAGIGAASFCFLIGHLIWYPEDRRD
jgi:Na+-transporting NADH:ubiquinone oxidoreductase subunit NqrB